MNVYLGSLTLLAVASMAPLSSWAQGCSLSLSPADIDFGQLNRTTLHRSAGELPLPVRRLSLNLLCDTEHDLTLSYYAADHTSRSFTLGDRAKYRLSVLQASVDDQPVQWAGRQANTGQPSTAGAAVLEGGYPVQPVRAGTVVKGRHMIAQVELRAALDSSVLDAADAQSWQARGTFEIAGQQRDMQLRVGFAPAACRPSLTGDGQVNFGRIGQGQLQRDAVTSLTRDTRLDVDCDAETRFAIRAVDNRRGSVADHLPAPAWALFGVGRSGAGQPLGGFTARLGVATGRDGIAASALLGDASAQTWRHDPEQLLRQDGRVSAFKRAHTPGTVPDAWRRLSIPLTLELHLAPARTLDLRQEAAIDGAATLEIVYL